MPYSRRTPYPRRRFRPRRRWKKKSTFPRNTRHSYNYSKIPATVMSNQLFVKLSFSGPVRLFQLPAGGSSDMTFLGNGLSPIGNITDGDLPSGINPGQPSIVAGERLLQGLQAYSQFFRKCTVLSSKIDLRIQNESVGNASTNQNVQVIGGAFAQGGIQENALIGLSNDDYSMQKGMQRRMLSGSGGKNSCRIKIARSTKKLLGLKNVQDDDQTSCVLTKNLEANGQLTNPQIARQWYYNFRVINPNGSLTPEFTYSYHMTFNCLFTQRTIWGSSVAEPSAPPV